MNLRTNRPARGLTLVEIMVVSVIASVVLLFLFNIMRHVGMGVTRIQRVVPLQRDLQIAQQVITKDLLSAPRSSIGNSVPNPGFEAIPPRISTFTPTIPGFWACPPQAPRYRTADIGQWFTTFISARTACSLNGNFGLTINARNVSVNSFANSSTFSLVNDVDYLFGGWVRINASNGAQWAQLDILGDATPWPTTTILSVSSNSFNWTFLASTFTAAPGLNYRVRVGATNPNTLSIIASFDDIIVTPLVMDLIPGSPPYDFDGFQTSGPSVGQRVRMRYRLIPRGSGGRLIREQWDEGSSVWRRLGSLDNIRRLLIAWDFGQVTPGALPPPASWPSLFARGMNFPLSLTIESGDVGATGNNTLSLTFSVFPVVP